MDLELRHRRALATGSTDGIGFAFAKGLAAEGAAVMLNGRSMLTRRFAAPEAVANLAVYLSSPRASATTGSALRVGGGVVNSIS